MTTFIIKRVALMIPTLFVISLISFVIMQAPPGDYLTSYMAQLAAGGESVERSEIDALRKRYGLDKPWYVQYYRWITNFLQGDFGFSFEWNRPVNQLIGQRLMLTIIISVTTLLFTWIVALAIGVFSAVKQYSFFDHFFTMLGFLGLATPNFMLALILMYVSFAYFGQSVGGLYSPDMVDAPWSWAKVLDLLSHMWIPVVVIGTAGTAGLMRIMRANLLDELKKPYVVTARAKGVPAWRALFKYPFRVAINPFLSTIGWLLPALISGEIIVSVVLSLQTTGPLYLRALQNQDMFLAGSFLMFLATLTVIGTLLSDLLLAWVDPRVRYD